MDQHWLMERLLAQPENPVILRGDRRTTYGDLVGHIGQWQHRLTQEKVAAGQAVLFDADLDGESLALFLALLLHGGIAVPLTANAVVRPELALEIAQPIQYFKRTTRDASSQWTCEPRPAIPPHPLYQQCREAGQGGLIIFTSGSTGVPKASLHRADRFLSKFQKPHPALRTLVALPFDHMAGLDSVLYAITSGGCVVLPEALDPEGICRAVARHQVELLPATPSLLNLIWLSGCLAKHDLSSLKIITYGAEVMPEITLSRLRDALPHCRFIQKYGATEFGSPPTRSREDGSVWFKVSGGDFEMKVVDATLWVRSSSSMLGYLNAPSPIDAEGWINTGDRVEVEGEYVRILGRQSEMINVGGQKINPIEVENVILAADNIQDAVVMGEKNPILGNTVKAIIRLIQPEDPAALRNRLRIHCRDRLPREAIPVRIEIADDQTWNSRYKKIRQKTAP